jgi:3-oxoacyl-[acyl-carrier protein] reductase
MSDKRLAVVTGAARGIGRAIVLALLQQGRTVAGLDLNAEQLKQLESAAKEAGHSVITRCVDITNDAKLTETLEGLAEEFGGVGILVNNAGITRDKLMMQMDADDYDKLMAVNLRAAFMATKTVLRSMVRNKFGRIINISSVAGVMGQAGSTNYAASKAGLIGMTKSIAREVGKKNITANCVAGLHPDGHDRHPATTGQGCGDGSDPRQTTGDRDRCRPRGGLPGRGRIRVYYRPSPVRGRRDGHVGGEWPEEK